MAGLGAGDLFPGQTAHVALGNTDILERPIEVKEVWSAPGRRPAQPKHDCEIKPHMASRSHELC